MTTVEIDQDHVAHRGRGRWHAVRHYLEMVVAMLVGMAVLLPLVEGAFGLVGAEAPDGPEATSLLMALSMTAGMTVWMRHRGHRWASTLEMGGAMLLPALALLPLLWAGAIDGDAMLMAEHVVMFPLMALVMWRRRTEYGW